MTFLEALADLNSRFRYSIDKTGERWRILRGAGEVAGDCEDYSLTLIWLAEGKSALGFWLALIRFKYVLWHCLSPGGYQHVVMWVRGKGWIDNIARKPITRAELKEAGYDLLFPYVFPLVAWKFLTRPVVYLAYKIIARFRS